MTKHVHGHKMNPKSLEALAKAREAAAKKRQEMGMLTVAQKKEQKRLADEAEAEKRLEELRRLVSDPEKPGAATGAATGGRKRACEAEGFAAPQAQEPELQRAEQKEPQETSPEALDWKNYYKQKYKAKLSMQREPEYATIARDRLREKVHAQARKTAWADVFPGIQNPYLL